MTTTPVKIELTGLPSLAVVNLIKILVENKALSAYDLQRLASMTPGLSISVA